MWVTSDLNNEGTCLLLSSQPCGWLVTGLLLPFPRRFGLQRTVLSTLKLCPFGKAQRVPSFSPELCLSCWSYFWGLEWNGTKSLDWNEMLSPWAVSALPKPPVESGGRPPIWNGNRSEAREPAHWVPETVPSCPFLSG